MTSPLPDEKTFPLSKPLEWGGQKVSELKLREPTAEEIEKVQRLEGMTQNLELIGVITGVPRPILGKLPIRTIRAMAEYLAGFTQGDLETGVLS